LRRCTAADVPKTMKDEVALKDLGGYLDDVIFSKMQTPGADVQTILAANPPQWK
jgi:hypothetical protein